MRPMPRLFLALALLIGPAAGASQAADIRELLLLKDAGLSDDILVDLIQSDGSEFHLKAADIIDLHKKGLSDRVISAMLATARKVASTSGQAVPPPDVPDAAMGDRARVDLPIAPDQAAVDTAQVPPDMTPPPVTVETVTQSAAPPSIRTEVVQVIVPVALPVMVERPHVAPPAPPPSPVYWGYGGQKKPGSWDEPQAPAPPAKPVPPKGGRGGR